MDREELIDKIGTAMGHIIFTLMGIRYTILVGLPEDDDYTIGGWEEDNEASFKTPEDLVDQYMIGGMPLGGLASQIKITEFC